MIPGEVIPIPGDLELNAGAAPLTLQVANAGDRPIQVGSHYHFAETNAALLFKIGWSYWFDKSGTGADALVFPALTGLVVVDIGMLVAARLHRKRVPAVAHD